MKVLFPLDGTDISLRALEKGLSLLNGVPNLRAIALYVRTPPDEGGIFLAAARELAGAAAREITGQEVRLLPAEDALAQAREIAEEHKLQVETKEVEGTIEAVMAEAARSYDLLVVHALTKRKAPDFFAGSASEQFVKNAPCSVLVVRD